MKKLYSNENFPLPVVEELRKLGYDVVTIQESGKAGQALPDESVLAFAFAQGRMVVTYNRKHFIHLHKQQHEHCGIVVCTVDADFAGLAQRIHKAIQEQLEAPRPLIRVSRPN